MLYNPTPAEIARTLAIPLYYTGLTDEALVTIGQTQPTQVKLTRDFRANIEVRIPPRGQTSIKFSRP
jgi:hypothetical protein